MSYVTTYERTRAALKWYFYEYLYEPLMIVWKNRKSRIGFIVLLLYGIVAAIGPAIVPLDLVGDPNKAWRPPSLEHPLGTDFLGRDILAIIIHGAPYILEICLLRGLFVVFIGLAIGVLAGYVGGKTDSALMALTDIVLNIPSLPLYIVLATYLAKVVNVADPVIMAALLSVTGWAALARSVRAQVLSLKTQPFIEAAKALGLPTWYIVFREITPNLMSYITVNYIWSAIDAVYISVGLYFLGLLPYTETNWGVLLREAVTRGSLYVPERCYFFLAPVIAIVGLQFGLILFSYAMDEIFNPRIRTEYFRALRR